MQVEPSEVLIEVTPTSRRARLRIWWGLIGTTAGPFVYHTFSSQVFGGEFHTPIQEDAIRTIHGALIGATIGFAIEFFAEGTWPKIPLQFRLRTFLAICYIIAVVIITIRNYLILRSL